MSNFHVGQKVVMVDDWKPHVRERAADEGVTLPTLGTIYTIRGMEPGVFNPSKIYLWLNEIHNGPCSDGIEANFCSSLFRPVVERKTDISCFTDMLNYKPKVVVLS